MKISSYFCFPEKCDLKPTLNKIFDLGIGFSPTFISCHGIPQGRFTAKKHFEMIKALDSVRSLRLADGAWNKSNESFELARIGDWWLQELWWETIAESVPKAEIIQQIIQHDLFRFGFRTCKDEMAGKTAVFIPEIRMQVGWQMWFGRGFFKWIPKEHLLAFPRFQYVEEKNGVVFAQLYADPFAGHLPPNQQVREDFCKWICVEELLRQGLAVRNQRPPDPMIEIEGGNFSRDGVTKMTHWLDRAGDLTRRSNAVRKLEVIRAANGEETSRSESEVKGS